MTYGVRDDVTSWGRVVREPQAVALPQFCDELPALVAEHPGDSILAAGLHRSYGDSALNGRGALIDMTRLDRLISFASDTGRLRAEAGVSLDRIIRFAVPRGFFLPVTPGTRFVSLGGAVANDVHGKNHHRMGTIGSHVTRLGLLRGNGERLEIGPHAHADLFAATVGGLGLTGIIEWAEITLVPITSSFLDVDTTAFATLNEFWTLAEAATDRHEHTVAWIDCARTGWIRGIFSSADWTRDGELAADDDHPRLRLPVTMPGWLLNGTSVGAFNSIYFHVQRRGVGRTRKSFAAVFYPLDAIGHWNRLYGAKGFWQYQCVLPEAAMREGIAELLNVIARSGQGSFLSVLKTFGNVPSPGLLSFPMPGATLALDFRNRGEETMRLFDRLDAIVRAAGGRIYAAKDGRVSGALWRAGYPRFEEFSKHIDPHFSSDFWRRVAA